MSGDGERVAKPSVDNIVEKVTSFIKVLFTSLSLSWLLVGRLLVELESVLRDPT